MRRVIRRTGALLALLMLLACRAVASSTATVTISGSEQQIGGVWDTSEMTISFNGFSETVGYGQFSTPSSIASAFAGMFSRDYAVDGLCAHASGAVITFYLKGSAAIGPITASGSTTSFSTSSSGGQGSGPPAPPPPPSGSCPVGSYQPRTAPAMPTNESPSGIAFAEHFQDRVSA